MGKLARPGPDLKTPLRRVKRYAGGTAVHQGDELQEPLMPRPSVERPSDFGARFPRSCAAGTPPPPADRRSPPRPPVAGALGSARAARVQTRRSGVRGEHGEIAGRLLASEGRYAGLPSADAASALSCIHPSLDEEGEQKKQESCREGTQINGEMARSPDAFLEPELTTTEIRSPTKCQPGAGQLNVGGQTKAAHSELCFRHLRRRSSSRRQA